ncbi:hypothetical protein ACFXG4_08460 [Nocardia sp. NPDC059246]|uniref:hypothetical protein n=1 Tax=unclassified Nocardia TaxID=2637762 RepID=UPI0036B06862
MTEVYTIEHSLNYKGCELMGVHSAREITDRAARYLWTQDPTTHLRIGAWTVDGTRRRVFQGDYTDYTDPQDPEDAPQWDPAPGVTP